MKDLLADVTFYASFDEACRGDFGGGELAPKSRFGNPHERDKFVFEPGFDEKIYRIAAKDGVAGGALSPTAVLPNNGRIYFPAKGNLPYDKNGWEGTLSMWINTDPNTLIPTKFSDPVQITQNGANNGGLWFDFNDEKPRAMRMGVFPGEAPGSPPFKETDADAPLIRSTTAGMKQGDWHCIVMTWRNLDTGKADAHAAFYMDGKLLGELKNRNLAMRWDIEKTGIYTAINYMGLLDEMAIFRRALSPADVATLYHHPALLTELKSKKRP